MSAPGPAEANAAIAACGLTGDEKNNMYLYVSRSKDNAAWVATVPPAARDAVYKKKLEEIDGGGAGGSGDPRSVSQLKLLAECREKKNLPVDDDVFSVIIRHYMDRLLAVKKNEDFLSLYRDAEERFGTSTKNAMIASDASMNLSVNGQMNFTQGSEAFFFRGLHNGQPRVLKFPPQNSMAQHEDKVYQEVSQSNHPGRQHLVPVQYVSISAPGHKLSRTGALMMPHYSSTLDSWPTHALMVDLIAKVGTSIYSALSAFHQVKLIHCDCKPGNIFIDTNGNTALGDYDAVVSENTKVGRCTVTFLPMEYVLLRQSPTGLLATPAVDFAMLACSLARMLNVSLPSGSGFYTIESLLSEVAKLESQLSSMTPSAGASLSGVLQLVHQCLNYVQKDSQYGGGADLLKVKQDRQQASAADPSSGNVDWGNIKALGMSSSSKQV